MQYHEASRFRAAASAAAAGAAPGLNEADRAYRQMVADPSSSVHPMLRYTAHECHLAQAALQCEFELPNVP